MATENVSENSNLSELYENLIVIGNHRPLSDRKIPLVTSVFVITDCGANLTNKKFFRDLDLVLKRSKDSGMENFHFRPNLFILRPCYRFLFC